MAQPVETSLPTDRDDSDIGRRRVRKSRLGIKNQRVEHVQRGTSEPSAWIGFQEYDLHHILPCRQLERWASPVSSILDRMHGIIAVVVDQAPVLDVNVLSNCVLHVLVHPLTDSMEVSDENRLEADSIVTRTNIASAFKDCTMFIVPERSVHRSYRCATGHSRSSNIVGKLTKGTICSDVQSCVVYTSALVARRVLTSECPVLDLARSSINVIPDETVGANQESVDPLHSAVCHVAVCLISSDSTEFSSEKSIEARRDGIDVWVALAT